MKVTAYPKEDLVVDISAIARAIPHTGPHNLISGLIDGFGDYQGGLQEAADRGREVPGTASASEIPVNSALILSTGASCRAEA